MDWSNESYVRLYTRDTTSWRRLGWDGQCVLMALLRKVDRAGTLDLDGLEPWEAVMLHIGCPEEVAQKGIAALLRVGTIEIRGACLVFPAFIEAQECIKSDKLRAREYRQHKATTGVTKRDVIESRRVTAAPGTVTQASRESETRHGASRDVTTRHSLLCSALPSSALPSERETRALDPPVPLPESSPPESDPPGFDDQAMRNAFGKAYERRMRTPASYGGKHVGGFHAKVLRTAQLQQRDARELFLEILTRWLEQPHDEVARNSPYACFCQAWGDLTAKGPVKTNGARSPPETLESLRKKHLVAVGEQRFDDAEKLQTQIRELQELEDRKSRYARA